MREKDRFRRAHGRRASGTFAALPHELLDSEGFHSLSGSAVKLLIDLCRQFNGRNNGDLVATWSMLSSRGWRSKQTIANALAELIERGMIEQTRQGGMHRCSLYALTWRPIDECKGKLDVKATSIPSRLWQQSRGDSKNTPPTPKIRSIRPEDQGNSEVAA